MNERIKFSSCKISVTYTDFYKTTLWIWHFVQKNLSIFSQASIFSWSKSGLFQNSFLKNRSLCTQGTGTELSNNCWTEELIWLWHPWQSIMPVKRWSTLPNPLWTWGFPFCSKPPKIQRLSYLGEYLQCTKIGNFTQKVLGKN